MCRKIYLNEFVDLLNNGMNKVVVGMFRSKWFVVLCVTVWLMPVTAWSQQLSIENSTIVSPEIHENRSVTFRIHAPKAIKVQVMGDFLQGGVADMVEKEDGVWEYTTPSPLESELYGYVFLVDGMKVHDPSNAFLVRDVATVSNVFIVGGGRADLYKVNDVPHGTVSKIYPTMELPIVRNHRCLPLVSFFILSIIQALESSPRRNPVREARTMRGT